MTSGMTELLFLHHNLLYSYQNTAKEGRSPSAPTAHCFIYIFVYYPARPAVAAFHKGCQVEACKGENRN